MEVETICRYNIPVRIVILNKTASIAAPTSNQISADRRPRCSKGSRTTKDDWKRFGGKLSTRNRR